ncbi:MAG: Mth938-like domain-containing protein [Candidatus Promineifilaceae bacterium]
MTDAKSSPKITKLSWGALNVEGYDKPFKDAKLYPGGARKWDWNETGTRHDPGIQPADVEELLAHGATVVVLSKGINRRLRIMPETRQWLEEKGVGLYVLQTEEAVKRYNELRQEQAVGALIHSTC